MKQESNCLRQPHFKIISLILFLFAVAVQGCGSDKPATPAVETAPVTADRSEDQVFQLGELAKQLQLEHIEKEMVFEDREVPSTCTRRVQRGTRQECHTEFDNRCHTEYENQCRQVAFPVCRNEPENVCRDVPDQVCRNETVPVCTTVPRRVCETQNVCREEMQHICDSRGCRDAPRRVCTPVQSCHNVDDRVCRNETRQHCDRITRRECRLEDRRVCHSEYREECSRVPRERCEQVPRQACSEVANFVDESFACTQTQSVAVGERVTLHQIANVKIDLRNPRNLDVTADSALVYLEAGRVKLEIQGENAAKYRIHRISQTVQRVSDTEQVITAHFAIEAL